MNPTVVCAASGPRPAAHNESTDTVSQRIPHIAEALTQAHVTCVQVKYDGQFDCGVMDDPIYLRSDGIPMHAGVSKGLQAELRTFFTELLELRFPQWDNAEGARGEFQWDLGSDLLAQAHIVRVTSYKAAVVTGL